ncbi:pentatricopeptide repeat-containing protein At2g22410, mitochondrial-like [Argentina anserina]|uniref:pentatricopeptide repeat-containing protein At2g22410, mitochondrial-like n=1 Tax=Argentina anserina TaxID=57926 RepID=UPI002176607A|nr:pentatricopeptide repeat-containing protein At2g22410, mitochondrial-like [Potentilla anserina]
MQFDPFKKQWTNVVKPRLQHYACVVDLLARSGMLEEAEKFIEEKMGGLGRGDANVWGALLSACRVHGNFEVGNRIWKTLADMGVADCGIHVLSYNLYKEAGLQFEAKKVRDMISEGGLKKKPGSSVIEWLKKCLSVIFLLHKHKKCLRCWTLCKIENLEDV